MRADDGIYVDGAGHNDKVEAWDVLRVDPYMHVHVGEVHLGEEYRTKGWILQEDVSEKNRKSMPKLQGLRWVLTADCHIQSDPHIVLY